MFLSFWREAEWWIIISSMFIAQVKQNVCVGTNWIYAKLQLKTNVQRDVFSSEFLLAFSALELESWKADEVVWLQQLINSLLDKELWSIGEQPLTIWQICRKCCRKFILISWERRSYMGELYRTESNKIEFWTSENARFCRKLCWNVNMKHKR